MPSIKEEDFGQSKVDLSLWRRLFSCSKSCRRNLAMVAVFMTFCAVGDTVFPLIMTHFIDCNIMKGTWDGAPPWIALYFILVFLQALNVFVFIFNAAHAENAITCDIRESAFEKLQELSFSFYDTTPVGYIM